MQAASQDFAIARSARRRRVLVGATIIGASGSFQVRIRDLSNSGANLCADARLPAGADVIFKRGDLFAAAKVAWSDATTAGIKFYRKLSTEDVASALSH
jgi:hypothetical protein